MKRALKSSLIALLGIIILFFALLITFPLFFKDKIRAKVEQVINESVNARVSFGDYRLGFFRNFPNLSFSLDNLTIAGIDKFENDTLASVRSINLVFDLSSLFSKTGYEIKSIIVKEAVVKTLVLADGSANWDIVKESDEAEEVEDTGSDMKIQLRKISLLNSSGSYIDLESSIEAYLDRLTGTISGDMTLSETDLRISLSSEEFTFIMDGVKYLNNAVADTEMDLLADLDKYKFTFRENYLSINDFIVNFTGWVSMPEDDIETDLLFSSEQTSFKTLLSLVPAIYMTDFRDLRASGEFSFSGSAKGIYSDADSTMPDIALDLKVRNGTIDYPSLPEKITNINIISTLFSDGTDADRTTIDIDAFHMELAGNPFDMTFSLRTPVSDPDFKGSLKGKLDLTALSQALPIDSISLSGLIDLSVEMAGRLSALEKEQYDLFRASGRLDIANMKIGMSGYPEIKINEAGFEFTPAFASMKSAGLYIGERSDFALIGRIENYIPWFLKNEVIRGNLSMHSKLVDMTEIMSYLTDTTTVADTTALALIKVPDNINFDFNAQIDQFEYDKIKAQNVRGHILVKDGILSIRETGLNILGGSITMNADYDTRDTLKPVMKADFSMESLAVRDAFNTFNTVQKLAPAAKGVDGRFNLRMTYNSLLGADMMPLIHTISGGGRLRSNEVTLVESASYDKMKELLNLGEKYNNTFRDLNVSFKVSDGRIYVSPFDTRVGNMKMNISGDQGIDQTLNYVIRTEIPRSELGGSVNSVIDNLSAQAAMFGIAYKPAEILRVNVKVTGTFSKPVITPFFGSSPGDEPVKVKEEIKSAVKQAVDEKAGQAMEKVRSEAEIQGERIVREAEERAQQLRDEAVKAAEKIRLEADAQAQRLIREAEPKGVVARAAAQKAGDSLKREAEKRAEQVIREADQKAEALVGEAKTRRDEMLKAIN
ncbi:MAG: AsmA family protein [Bacteroidales bacterium]|nr:AsmA family protein [Bacteroidales bacterium]